MGICPRRTPAPAAGSGTSLGRTPTSGTLVSHVLPFAISGARAHEGTPAALRLTEALVALGVAPASVEVFTVAFADGKVVAQRLQVGGEGSA